MKAAMAHTTVVNGVLLPLLTVHGSMATMALSVLSSLLQTILPPLSWMPLLAAVITPARRSAR